MITINQLPNGLRFAVDEMKDVETASIAVFVNSGSRNEDKSNNGISHFLEHMAFKGTKTRNAKEIAEQFDNIGGKINAYTSREKTVYYVKILKDDVEFAVEFLSDILQNSVFDSEEVERERGVILQEIAMTNDTPDDIIFDYFQETAFPKQAIGRSILGPAGNIKKFTRDDLLKYLNRQYNYSNMAVAAAGNLEMNKFGELVGKYFGNLGDKEIAPPQKSSYQGGYFRKQKKLEQTHILLGFEGLSYMDDDYYSCQILSSILGGGMSSRLFQEVREKRGLAYSVYSFNAANYDSGIFAVYSATSADKADELVKVVSDELLKITENISDAEHKRAVMQIKSGLLMSKESTNSRSQKLGGDILAFGRVISYEEILEKLGNITKQDLTKTAQRIIAKSPPTFSAIGDVKGLTEYDKVSGYFA